MGSVPTPENAPDPITGRLPTMGAPEQGGEKPKKAPAARSAKKSRRGGGFSRGAGIGIAMAVGIASLVGVYAWNSATSAKTVDVYVLTNEVAANQMLTSSDLKAATVEAELAPPNALTKEELQAARWFAAISLPAGTVVQDGIVQTALRTLEELPEGLEPASFSVDPENAVAGRVQAGSYVNLFAVIDGTSTLVQSKLYILNAQPDVNSVARGGGSIEESEKPGPDNPSIYGGIPSLYTAAVTPEQAATIALLQDSGATFYMTLTTMDAPDPGNVVVTEADLFGAASIDDSNASTPGIPEDLVIPEPTQTPAP